MMSIYDADTFSSFFSAFVQSLKHKNPRFSYEVICRAVSIKSPSGLAMIANGRRLPTSTTLEKLATFMKLSDREKEYAYTLVQMEREADEQVKAHLRQRLKELAPPQRGSPLDISLLEQVPAWLVVAIGAMVCQKSFNGDPGTIASRLEGASVPQVELILEQFVKHGILKEVDGALKSTGTPIFFPRNMPDWVKQYYIHTMETGIRAAQTFEKADRKFSSWAVSIDRKDLATIHELVSDFMEKLIARYECKDGDDVFQIGLMMYKVTKNQRAEQT